MKKQNKKSCNLTHELEATQVFKDRKLAEQTLEAGTPVRSIREAGIHPVTDEIKYSFQAQNTETGLWYYYESYTKPLTTQHCSKALSIAKKNSKVATSKY